MINYKWAMFNSYVKLPEGTQQKHTQTVIFINQLKRGFEWSDPHQMQWIPGRKNPSCFCLVGGYRNWPMTSKMMGSYTIKILLWIFRMQAFLADTLFFRKMFSTKGNPVLREPWSYC